MIVTLDFDDYSPLNNGYYFFEQLRERYPNFKVTVFTVPWEIRWQADGNGTPITDPKFDSWVSATKKAIEDGWMEICIHGLTHLPGEFHKLNYNEAKKRVIVAEKMLTNRGIGYQKLFKAPNWQINKKASRAVKDLGFKVVKDGYYNWNLKDEIPNDDGIVIGHGHIQDDPSCGNGLEESFIRITKIPENASWKFLSQVI